VLTEATIRDLLRHCYDPAIPLNIVDLGLIHSIHVTHDAEAPGAGIPGVPARYRVSIELLAASDDEAAQAQLCAQVENLLAGVEHVARASVQFVSNPTWTPASITPEGRRQLKLDATPFAILNNRLR
jgi:metal-sulfur cluster biosynthetic enzyme